MTVSPDARPETGLRRFNPYPAYKDSGVEWLGEIPASWILRPLKRALRQGSADGSLIKGRMHQEPGEGLFPGFSASGQDIWVEEAQHHNSGIVLSAVGARCGKTFKADGSWTAVANTHVLFPEKRYDRDFLWYLTNDETFWDRGGTAQPFVRVAATLQRPWCFPAPSEQRAIAAFLDRETAKIDALVTKKERLIELLREKRTALITRAVSKGLDPNVPMKDSGVEWLGKIPAHWEVRRIAMAAVKITNGFVGPTRDILVNEGVRYLQSLHIKQGLIDFDRHPYFVTPEWSREHQKSVLAEGDVLIVQTGDIGQVAVVPKDSVGCNCHALIVIRLKPGLGVGTWLSTALQSNYGRGALKWSQTGALHPHLECGHVREIRVAFPPESEQVLILGKLAEEFGELDRLLAKVHDAIDRLTEYRTALISAAVTGKIDVRGEDRR